MACRTAFLRAVVATSSFGERLRVLRGAADLTIESLAERSGVSTRTISDIERGVSFAPQRRTVAAIADGLALVAGDREALLRAARIRRQSTNDGQRSSALAPHRVVDFTGREQEITEILAFLKPREVPPQSAPVVVVSGPPGMGKTAS